MYEHVYTMYKLYLKYKHIFKNMKMYKHDMQMYKHVFKIL